MMRYAKDPYRMTARYPGTDSNGVAFHKGDEVTYYPNGKRIISGEAGRQAWRDFLAAQADESFLAGY